MDVFDVLGPVMIGPSSSHTAGAVRLGRTARALLGEDVCYANITLHGSFAKTYQGHGTDKALVAGLLGMHQDDEQIKYSLDIAKSKGVEIIFQTADLMNASPNTVLIEMNGKSGATSSMQGSSIGGGEIIITKVNGLSVSVPGERDTLIVLHFDKPGLIAAVANELSKYDLNISDFHLSRNKKGGIAVMVISVDFRANEECAAAVRNLENVINVTVLYAQ